MIEIKRYLFGCIVLLAVIVKTVSQFFYKKLWHDAFYHGEAIAWTLVSMACLLILYQKQYLYFNIFTRSVLWIFFGLTINNTVDELSGNGGKLNWTEPVFVALILFTIFIAPKLLKLCLRKKNRSFGKGL